MSAEPTPLDGTLDSESETEEDGAVDVAQFTPENVDMSKTLSEMSDSELHAAMSLMRDDMYARLIQKRIKLPPGY